MGRKNKKLTNPFEGKEGLFDPKGKASGETTNDEAELEAMLEDMRRMEKELGPKRFKKLFYAAVEKSLAENPDFRKNYEDFTSELLSDDDEDEDWDDDDDDDWDDDDLPILKQEWENTHPANLKCGSDQYYADLANELATMIDLLPLPPSIPEGFCRELGKVLAAYLEDLVSGTKVFAAMRRVCQERYGYQLPFYDCSHAEYMPDHLNEEDIKFLVWKTISIFGQNRNTTYSPLAPAWETITSRAFDVLNERFEDAPEATRVADWLRKTFRKGDYMDVRETATWLVMENPLTYFPGRYEDIMTDIEDIVAESNLNVPFEQLFYGYLARQAWQRSMSPMGCPTRTLVAAMAKELGYHERSIEIEAITVLPLDLYKVTQHRKSRRIVFESPAHVEFDVERNSFAKTFRPDEIGYASCTLVCYQGKYLLNGLLSGTPDLKEKWENMTPLLTYEQQRELVTEWIDALDGQQVVCTTNLKKFLKQLDIPSHNDALNWDAKNFVVLISRELGIAFVPDAGYAFDIPGNRLYRKRKAEKESFSEFVFVNMIPQDVALYIQEHNLLPEAQIGASQSKETGRRIVQDYLAFWIGFYRELPPYGDTPATLQTPREE